MDDPWADFKPANPEPGDPWAGFEAAKEPKAEPGQPSFMDALAANPVLGAPGQTLMRAGQGLTSLGVRGVESVLPNAIRGPVTAMREGLEQGFEAENKGYEGSKRRIISTSTNPRVHEAMINTGEVMGNLLNPAGMAGNIVPKIPAIGPLLNAGVRGTVSGVGYGLSQPVPSGTENYALEKAKQAGIGGLTGFATGTAAERLLNPPPKLPTTADLKQLGSSQFQAVARDPVPVTTGMADALQGKFGQTAIKRALHGAEVNRDAVLASDLQSLLVPNQANLPQTVSADAAHKISQEFRDLGISAMKNDQKYVGKGWFGRRADVENALTAVPEIKTARATWAQYEKSDLIDKTIQAAQDTARSPAGASDLGQAMRREFQRIVKDQDLMDTFSDAEQKLLRRVSDGTLTSNSLQQLGKLSPMRNYFSKILVLLGGGTGYQAGGISGAMPALGLAAVSEGARQGAIGTTSRQATKASELMRTLPALSPQAGPAPNIPVGNAASSLLLNLLLQPRGQ